MMAQYRGQETHRLVHLRDNSLAGLRGKGELGRVLVGLNDKGNVMCWNLDGRYRWDGVDDARDIVKGLDHG